MVDDASTDATDIAEKSSNVNLAIDLPSSETPRISARPQMPTYLRQVEGDYVAILDGDDAVIDSHVLEDFGAYSDGYDVVWSLHHE